MCTYHIEHFDNIASFLETCDSREYNEWARHRRDEFDEWSGDSYSRARELLQAGDAAEVKRLRPRALPRVADTRPKNITSVIGYAPIVPAAVMNVPTCMIDRQNAAAKNKIIHILYDVDASCGIKKSQMIEQGKRVAAFIMSVERAGYRVQLDAMSSFQQRYDNDKYAVSITLKEAARPLDIKRLTYPLLHISMLRQLCFDWYERYPDAAEVGGYGLPLYHETEAYQQDFISHMTRDKNAVYITFTTDIDRLYNKLTGSRAR